MSTVGELCERDVVVATPDTTVAGAAKLMRHRHVGSLVIVDRTSGSPSHPVGIVTDRDIVVEVTATDVDPNELTVADVMSEELVTVRADADALDALQTMRSKGVRRLPVVTAAGALVGVVAFDDLLQVLAEQLQTLSRVVGREHTKETASRK